MTHAERIAAIIKARGDDPDIGFLLDEIDVCATVLKNLVEDLDAHPELRDRLIASEVAHARGLSSLVAPGSALLGRRRPT
jgi:hypothetical protein